MKKTILAVAVATVVAAPIAAQAESKLTGSLRYGVAFTDNGDDTDAEAEVRNFGSRIKYSGSADLDNGMSSFGKLELRLSDARNGAVVNRLYAVGVKGGFGTVSLGVQDSAIDLIATDRTWWNGGTGLVTNRNEKNGVIKYENSVGDISFAVAAQMVSGDDDGDAADLIDAGVLYSANGITAGVGLQTLTGEVDDAGNDILDGTAFVVTGGYDFGGGDVKLTYGVEDEDFNTSGAEVTGLYLEAGFGDAYLWFGSKETDGGDTPTGVGLGYTQKLGPQTLIWYEVFQNDPDDGSDADVAFNAALKIDF